MNPEEFEQLSDEDQEKIFHQTPFRERGELFLYSNHPERLIKSLSQARSSTPSNCAGFKVKPCTFGRGTS